MYTTGTFFITNKSPYLINHSVFFVCWESNLALGLKRHSNIKRLKKFKLCLYMQMRIYLIKNDAYIINLIVG